MALSDQIGRLLGRGSTTDLAKKESAVSGVMVHRPGAPVWTPRRYDSLADEGYRLNPIAYKCIRLIAVSTARLPWRVLQGSQPVDQHPILDLLARPCPQISGQSLREALFSHYLTAGNAYLEAVAGQTGPIKELYVLRPDRMKVVPGSDGLRGYQYSVGGRQHRFGPTDLRGQSPILHLRTFNPLDDWYGMSPLEAAARAVDQHNEASAWNKAILQILTDTLEIEDNPSVFGSYGARTSLGITGVLDYLNEARSEAFRARFFATGAAAQFVGDGAGAYLENSGKAFEPPEDFQSVD